MICAHRIGFHISNEDGREANASARGMAKHPEEQANDGFFTHDMVAAGGMRRRRQRKS